MVCLDHPNGTAALLLGHGDPVAHRRGAVWNVGIEGDLAQLRVKAVLEEGDPIYPLQPLPDLLGRKLCPIMKFPQTAVVVADATAVFPMTGQKLPVLGQHHQQDQGNRKEDHCHYSHLQLSSRSKICAPWRFFMARSSEMASRQARMFSSVSSWTNRNGSPGSR